MGSILGERIRIRRTELGWSQSQLAGKLDGYSSRSAISKVEKGVNDLTQSKVAEFASALKTTSAYLLGWTDDPYDYELDENSLLSGIPDAWRREWQAQGLSAEEMYRRYLAASEPETDENKKTPDNFVAVESLSEDRRYLIDRIMSLPDDRVRRLRVIVDQVLELQG